MHLWSLTASILVRKGIRPCNPNNNDPRISYTRASNDRTVPDDNLLNIQQRVHIYNCHNELREQVDEDTASQGRRHCERRDSLLVCYARVYTSNMVS